MTIDNWLSATIARRAGQATVQTGVGFYHYVVNEEDERDFREDIKGLKGVKDEK